MFQGWPSGAVQQVSHGRTPAPASRWIKAKEEHEREQPADVSARALLEMSPYIHHNTELVLSTAVKSDRKSASSACSSGLNPKLLTSPCSAHTLNNVPCLEAPTIPPWATRNTLNSEFSPQRLNNLKTLILNPCTACST